jgi:glycine cleavage system H protein
VGISSFAADQLQDITFIKLPAAGDDVAADRSFGEIETVKAVSDLYSPVSGTVAEVNQPAADNPDLIKNAPFGDGWLVKVRVAPGSTLNHLQSYDDYQKQVASEAH